MPSNTTVNIKISALSLLVIILIVTMLFLSCQKSKSESELHTTIKELKDWNDQQLVKSKADSIERVVAVSTRDSLSLEHARTAAALRGLRDSLERAPVDDGLSPGQPPILPSDSVKYYRVRYERVGQLYAIAQQEIMTHLAEINNLHTKDSIRVAEINSLKEWQTDATDRINDLMAKSISDQSCLDLLIVKIPCPSREVMFVSGVVVGWGLRKVTS